MKDTETGPVLQKIGNGLGGGSEIGMKGWTQRKGSNFRKEEPLLIPEVSELRK